MKKLILILSCILCYSSALMAQWNSLFMTEERNFVATAQYQNELVIAGGDNGFGVLNSADILDLDLLTWKPVVYMPVQRFAMAGVSGDNGAYFACGANTSPPSVVDGQKEVYMYTTANGFTLLKTLYEGSVFPKAIKAGNKIIIAIGLTQYDPGQSNPYTISHKVYIYDELTMLWDSASLSLARFDMAMATDGDMVIFAGGQTGPQSGDVTDVVDIYDITTGQWSVSNLDTARTGAAAAFLNGKFYVAGGAIGTLSNTSSVEIYDPGAGSWSYGNNLSKGRWGMRACTCGNDIIFAQGGEINLTTYFSDSPYGDVEFYDSNSQMWTLNNLSGRLNHSAITASSNTNEYAIIVGGKDSAGSSNDLAFWDCGSIVSLNSNDLSVSMTLFPNPFTDMINLTTKLDQPMQVEVTLTDIYGREVYSSWADFGSGSNSLNIDGSELPQGVYLINLRTTDGMVTKKIIKH